MFRHAQKKLVDAHEKDRKTYFSFIKNLKNAIAIVMNILSKQVNVVKLVKLKVHEIFT